VVKKHHRMYLLFIFYQNNYFKCFFLYSKNRVYEKERRDRLNVSFEELRTVLPPSDSNASLGKADIINHAIDLIRVLQNEKLKTSSMHSK